MSAPSQQEPNYEYDEQLAGMMDEREEYEWSVIWRIRGYDPQLAQEVAILLGLGKP